MNQVIEQRSSLARRSKHVLVLLIAIAALSLAVTASANLNSTTAVDGASLFNRQCAQCHGRDGRAKTRRGRQTHTRDISNAEWQNDISDERIFNSISRGKGKMPAFKKLSDGEIDALIAYVRRLRK
jgi:mono/diheme cytochrome c family protein